jgi:ribosomal protein S18 acetylase RimI-like enzyme
MMSLNSKLITFERAGLPTVTLDRVLAPQLIAFELNKPYVLSFQPIERCQFQYKNTFYPQAFFMDVYERMPKGHWAGHLFSHVSEKELFLSHKDRVPHNQFLSGFARAHQIMIDEFKRYHDYTFGFETLRRRQGLGTLLFGLCLRIGQELYGCRRIVIDVNSEAIPFYEKRFAENQIKMLPHQDVRILAGEW